ncbi:hypothetical protein D3C84_889220 [compost metagenome]
MSEVLTICQFNSKACRAGICVIRWSRAVMVPPEVNTAIFWVLSAWSRMRCKPACTRSTNPSQLSRPGVSKVPASQRSMIRAKIRWNSPRFCAALRRMSRASGSSGSMAGSSARITASASNSLKAESVSSSGTGRPAAANCSSALLAVCCWRRRSPARQRSKLIPSSARCRPRISA